MEIEICIILEIEHGGSKEVSGLQWAALDYAQSLREDLDFHVCD